MAFEFTMPDMGDMESADVGEVKVREGDRVTQGQPLLVMEGEKAVFDVESPTAGVIVRLLVKSGDRVTSGQPLAVIEAGAGAPAPAPRATGSSAAPAAPPAPPKAAPARPAAPPAPPSANGATSDHEFRVPDMGDMESADVGEVHVAVGTMVQAGQPLAALEGEKAVFDLESPYEGQIVELKIRSGDKLRKGDLVAVIRTGSGGPVALTQPAPAGQHDREPIPPADHESSARPTPAPAAARTTASPAPAGPPALSGEAAHDPRKPAPAGPATRRLARQLGVNLHAVRGSGPGGRITREDLQAYVRERLAQAARPAASGGIVAPALPDFEKFGPVHREPLNKIGQAAARNLAVAWSVIPHVTQHDVADITELEAGRKRFNASTQPGRPKVTMTAFIMKAAVAALKQYPHFNASYDAERQEVIYKRYYHLGVAVDTPHGLVVPVIRDVDKKSIRELAAELSEVADKARDRKLNREAMSGGTFTITNLGGIGGTAFTPIVNWPEVAILGISKARWEYVIDDKGSPHIRLLMPLSLSYDHRVINGADGARFLRTFADLMSDLSQLVIEA